MLPIYIIILLFVLLFSLSIQFTDRYIDNNRDDTYNKQSFVSPISFHSNPKFEFLSEIETRDFLDKDTDGYINSLTKADLHARGCESSQLYKQRCCLKACDLSFVGSLKQAIVEADKWFRSSSDAIKSHGIDSLRICQLPWRVAFVKGDTYENGLPHTRGDIIFLSDTLNYSNLDNLVKTLIHEKVHIYQRVFLKEVQEYLEGVGYIRSGLAHGMYPLARSNPDTDGYVYLRPGDRKPMVAIYRSAQPSSISDIVSSPFDEHPFEKMAYDVERLFSS